jgi:hypothetical protein
LARRARDRCVRVPPGVGRQDEAGRLWDVVWLLRCAIARHGGGRVVGFAVHVRNDKREGTPLRVRLKVGGGPGDRGEPVLTVMLWERIDSAARRPPLRGGEAAPRNARARRGAAAQPTTLLFSPQLLGESGAPDPPREGPGAPLNFFTFLPKSRPLSGLFYDCNCASPAGPSTFLVRASTGRPTLNREVTPMSNADKRMRPLSVPRRAAEVLARFVGGFEAERASGRRAERGDSADAAVRALLAGGRPGAEQAELVGRLARRVLRAAGSAAFLRVEEALTAAAAAGAPRWEPAAHQLWWGGVVVKGFRHDAANQEAVLDAFQAAAWSPCIDDPLPRVLGLNTKVRRRETIRGLNHGLAAGTIRFASNGTGTGVRWFVMA